MKTEFAKPATVRGDWYVIDASGKTLGRLCSRIALRLKGKHKADYSPHVDMGDHIVVLHADKIAVTGHKLDDKIYYHHTGFLVASSPSHWANSSKSTRARDPVCGQGHAAEDDPGRKMFRKLHVFAGDKHPHSAQQPKPLEL